MEIIQHSPTDIGDSVSIVVDNNGYHSNGAPLSLPPRGIDFDNVDVIALFLQSQSNENTRRNYQHSLEKFFGPNPSNQAVREFLMWPPAQLANALQIHRNKMIENGASSAAINGRLAAVKSLLKFAYRREWSISDGRNLIDMEPVVAYRDTRGISAAATRKLLRAPGKRRGDSVHGLRDTAIVFLFVFTALRCNEVRTLNVGDFDLMGLRLRILGKGRRQQEWISLPKEVAVAIKLYLDACDHADDKDGALFRNFDHRPNVAGQRLTNKGISHLLDVYKTDAGVSHLRPHQLRHTAISNLLLESDGNIFLVKQFSRHIDPKVLDRYWDNIKDLQGEGAELLVTLFMNKPRKKKKAA